MRKSLLRILGWVSFISIVFYVLFGRHFAMVLIGGDSMDPYIKDKELIIMEKTYEGWTPQRYDVVVVWDGVEKLAKRIIGLEGDRIQIKGGLIYLNGEELKDIYRHGKISIKYVDEDDNILYYWGTSERAVENIDEAELIVPKGHVWVIGDNRSESWYGVLPIRDVVGRVLF